MTTCMKLSFPERPANADPLYAHGRNGYFEATAINVMPISDYILLENWTSKHAIGRGRVILPADRNTVRDLIAHRLP